MTGIIAAATNNKVGIAGINPGAKIMVLKGLNAFGHGRASSLAEAVFYAANNGAQVINISAGGKYLTQTEQDAVSYAYKKGAVIVVAAGNEAVDTKDYSPSGLKNVIAVGATDQKDKRASFSNWGQTVNILAPGIDVLSLRTRRADFMLGIPDVDYKSQTAYVGEDKRYFRASGSFFAAPMVAAMASLILAKSPNLINEQVERMLLNSTRDIEVSGWDQLTGYGLLEAISALKADPDFYALAKIKKMVSARKDNNMVVQVIGTADSSDFKMAWVELGYGEEPEEWKKVGKKLRQ
ncbi:MAG: putative peptidase [Candidatus Scalindua rubra]|uniref:Putative peptidase n=1 Tax=Candidatus Scalindua rubra TaxID=1872076 RepID=A0A1E3XEG0_9BACT|nr:MAG: putative peptidase [Candidatus Scalindua rubra]